MPDPDIDAMTRDSRRVARLRRDARCERCRDPRHLKEVSGKVLCYACRKQDVGASPTELDHLAGRANLAGLLVRLRANDHRTVTELRLRMGVDGWPDAEGDPLLTLAHVLAGIASLLFLFAEWLVELAGDVATRLGPDAWNGAPPGPIVP